MKTIHLSVHVNSVTRCQLCTYGTMLDNLQSFSDMHPPLFAGVQAHSTDTAMDLVQTSSDAIDPITAGANAHIQHVDSEIDDWQSVAAALSGVASFTSTAAPSGFVSPAPSGGPPPHDGRSSLEVGRSPAVLPHIMARGRESATAQYPDRTPIRRGDLLAIAPIAQAQAIYVRAAQDLARASATLRRAQSVHGGTSTSSGAAMDRLGPA